MAAHKAKDYTLPDTLALLTPAKTFSRQFEVRMNRIPAGDTAGRERLATALRNTFVNLVGQPCFKCETSGVFVNRVSSTVWAEFPPASPALRRSVPATKL